MYMVRHHDITVKIIMSDIFSIPKGFDHHASDARLAKVERAGARVIQNAIHRKKGLSGTRRRGEAAIRREAAKEAPGKEDRAADRIQVR